LAVEDERTYRGQVRVKLGPVAVAFQGRARLEEVNEAARTVKVKASGTEMKGRGSAQADVMFRMQPDGDGTKVDIDTDVNLAGAVAQYGRAQGVIADVAQAVIDTFAENLRKQIAAQNAPAGDTARAAQANTAASEAPSLSAFAILVAVIRRWLGRLTGKAAL
jgi:carbon monoxide dehydrogenase subunit G